MNSSPDPPVDDGMTFLAAARLHARRFDRSIASSMFLLNASDRLVTDSAGGVLAMTDLRRSKWRLTVLVTMFVGGLAVVLWAGLRGLLTLVAISVAALLILLIVVAPRTVRSLRAGRRHEVDGPAWLVTDVAAEPGRHIADHLVGRAREIADQHSARLVLDVADTNASATRLYERHGFVAAESDATQMSMIRVPGPSTDRPEGVG